MWGRGEPSSSRSVLGWGLNHHYHQHYNQQHTTTSTTSTKQVLPVYNQDKKYQHHQHHQHHEHHGPGGQHVVDWVEQEVGEEDLRALGEQVALPGEHRDGVLPHLPPELGRAGTEDAQPVQHPARLLGALHLG